MCRKFNEKNSILYFTGELPCKHTMTQWNVWSIPTPTCGIDAHPKLNFEQFPQRLLIRQKILSNSSL